VNSYIPLVYCALLVVVVGIAYAGWVILKTEESDSLEKSKVRFAAATFTGIMLLIVFTATLYFVDSAEAQTASQAGKAIFERVVTALTPIAGGIIGYLFAARKE